MWWWRTRESQVATLVRDPLVLSVTQAVTRDTVNGIVAQVGRIAVNSNVVIDLTAIPEFDTDGASALIALQESLGAERVAIVGFRQATARLVEVEDPAAPAREDHGPWVVRRLRAIAVVQSVAPGPVTTDELEPAIDAAAQENVGIIVIDLRGAVLGRGGLQTIAFAGSAAALRGQELLVVNADADTAERLRRAGLSATTYIAPEPPAGS